MKHCHYILQAIVLLFLGFAGYAAISKYGTISLYVQETEEVYFCGVTSPGEPYFPGSVDGKALYQARCQSCHGLYKDLTGPALASIGENPFWSDTKRLAQYLRNPNSFQKYKYISELRKKFGSVPTAFPETSDEEAAAIMEYIVGTNARRGF